MLKATIFIPILIFLFSCGNQESNEEFKSIKSDLEAAAKEYCECMAIADTSSSEAIKLCQDILNDQLLLKCGENEIAKKFVHKEIEKCILKRRGDED